MSNILKKYTITKLDDISITIENPEFFFTYTIANAVLKEEFKDQYEYVGGLQCNYAENSPEHKELLHSLVLLARHTLSFKI